MKKSLLTFALIFAILFQSSYVVFAAKPEKKGEDFLLDDVYSIYLAENGGLVEQTGEKQTIESNIEKTEISADKKLDWEFFVENDGWYIFEFDYCSANDGGSSDYIFDFMLDGKIPFANTKNINLPRYWKSGKITEGLNGNDVRPEITESLDWYEYTLKDSEGVRNEPYAFYLSQGNHTITLKSEEIPFVVKNLSLTGYSAYISYEEYKQKYSDTYKGEKPHLFEAELYSYTNSISVNIANDLSSPLTTPYSIENIKLNTLGGSNWKYAGEKVVWNINVPESGLYAITFRYKQNFQQGLNSYRSLYVNGEIPFKEAASISFEYNDSWAYELPEWSIYLEKGENTIALENTVGDLSNLLVGTNKAVSELNKLYRTIVMITSPTPDVNRDYGLDDEIPNLKNNLLDLAKLVDSLANEFKKYIDSNAQIYILNDTSRQLYDMANDIRSITKSGRLDRFKSNISSMATFQMSLREQPLLLDSFTLSSIKKPYEGEEAGFFKMFVHKFKRFIRSFTDDYVALENDADQITVWMASGRDQLKVLEDLINNDFTPKSGINVKLQLVDGSLIQAILAGKGPDVALGQAETNVVNFAMRGALAPLNEMQGYEEITKRFSKTAMDPLTYKEEVYALPETQSFDMMFVRTDILEELNLETPKTWEDFTENTFTVLKRNNLTVGLGNLNNGGTITGIFPVLLSQMGGTIYSDDLLSANLTAPEALEAFEFAVSLYRDYGLPQEYDFMNRFRTGEMPIAIAPYASYNTLQVGAPEIAGLWEMLEIPGVKNEDGSINNTQIMTSTAGTVIKSSKNKEASWKFLDWWTSADIQKRFGLQQESLLGPSGRYTTANNEALRGLSWSTSQLVKLEAQRDVSICLTHVPGNYYTGKAINNAMVISVTQEGVIAREELIKWDELIDNELTRKQKEFKFKGRTMAK